MLELPDHCDRVDGKDVDRRGAYFRRRCLEKYRDSVAAAGWDSIIFDVGRDSLQRVPMMDPARGGADTTEALLDRCDTAAELLDALQR